MNGTFRASTWAVMAILLMALSGLGIEVAFSSTQEFSADSIQTTGPTEEVSTLYYRPDRWRVEGKSMAFPVITIFRLDKKVIWTLLPQDKKCLLVPLTDEDLPMPPRIIGEIERRIVGQEEVEGFLCEKLIVRVSKGNEFGEIQYWIARDLGIPIRSESLDSMWKNELKNIKLGPQPDGLFEIPPGYSEFTPPADFVQ